MAEPVNNQAQQTQAQRMSQIAKLANQIIGLMVPGEEISLMYNMDKIIVPGQPQKVAKLILIRPAYIASMHIKQ